MKSTLETTLAEHSMTRQRKTGETRGAKSLYGKPMRRINLVLDDESMEFLSELGGDNISQGVRRAAEILRKSMGWKSEADESRRKAA